jgi:hypothetical protein
VVVVDGKEADMLSRAATEVGFWTPATKDTVAAIGAALCAHWAAAKAAAQAQFWGPTTQQNWLDVPRRYLNRVVTNGR